MVIVKELLPFVICSCCDKRIKGGGGLAVAVPVVGTVITGTVSGGICDHQSVSEQDIDQLNFYRCTGRYADTVHMH